jgi:hypothetical protein
MLTAPGPHIAHHVAPLTRAHIALHAAAGTIGARGNNGVGVVGVCQRGVKIIPSKFMGTRYTWLLLLLLLF